MHNLEINGILGCGIKGIYQTKVVENPLVSELRLRAADEVGLPEHLNYDGSAEMHIELPDFYRRLVDKELSKLVEKNAEALNQPCEESLIKEERAPANNLILDQGINRYFQDSGSLLESISTYNAIGTGTTAVVTDSGAVTATTSGLSTTITSSSSFFTAGMVGQLIKFDSGEERYIQSQTGTACVVTAAVNIASPTLFAVWAVNQTGLATEVKRTANYLTGTGNCGTTDVGNVRTLRRTYDHTAEVSNTNYTESGWSWTSTAGNNLFSRVLISGGSVTVLIGQQLRMVYDLVITSGPAVSTAGTWAITGWPVAPATTVDGDYIVNSHISGGVSTSGNVSPSAIVSPSNGQTIILGTGSTLPPFGSSYSAGTSVPSNTSTVLAYTLGSFTRTWQGVFNLTTGNATNWRGIALQVGAFVFVFDQAQTKANTRTLTVRVSISMSRPLTNP
jgi:hypothetical protein